MDRAGGGESGCRSAGVCVDATELGKSGAETCWAEEGATRLSGENIPGRGQAQREEWKEWFQLPGFCHFPSQLQP